MTKLHELHELGQSTWLNYMRRAFVRSGELRSLVNDGIHGITANAATFQKAISASSDYDDAVRHEVAAGTPARLIGEALMVDDAQHAADRLRPIFEETEGDDGFASIELDPSAMRDADSAVAAARHLLARIDRDNVMIELPATAIGLQAVKALTGDGISFNATHLFSVAQYEKVAQAYIEGLEYYFDTHSVWRKTPAAVASFSLSPIDSAIDPLLRAAGHPELQSKTALAMAKVLYHRSGQIFTGPRWEALARRGARALRPKWTRLQPRNFNVPETFYVDGLIGPGTVMTFSRATLHAFLNQGVVAPTLETNLEESTAFLARLQEMGIDLETVTETLQRKYMTASDRAFHDIVTAVSQKREDLETDWQRLVRNLGRYEAVVDNALEDLCDDRVIFRIWSGDHTVWQDDPKEIVNRLGWLHAPHIMQDRIAALQAFAGNVLEAGFNRAVLIGMGGSSLAPELFQATFGRQAKPPAMPHPYLDLAVLDTTDPDAIKALDASLDYGKTLFIVSSKSGTTTETLAGFKHFYNRMAAYLGGAEAGRHFVAITDPGSPLIGMAAALNFLEVFVNDPNIGGRYSALSYFGLVPAALVGVDLDTLLSRADAVAVNAETCHYPLIQDNLGAQLGAIMGTLALNGRDKLTLITSLGVRAFGDWAEQLIAESTGKGGLGIVPIIGERLMPPKYYGDDRLFVVMRLEGDTVRDGAVADLAAAGHPVVTLNLKDPYDLGGQLFLWEMATAVAAHLMDINPFDQPDVEAAKNQARQLIDAFRRDSAVPNGAFSPPTAPALAEFMAGARQGDYVSLQAYAQPTPEMNAALNALRECLLEQHQIATTVGYGPRLLHSTGQLHKGGPDNGLFIQFVSDNVEDVPIPDEPGSPKSTISFGVLKRAQALGDARELEARRRRIVRFRLGADAPPELRRLIE